MENEKNQKFNGKEFKKLSDKPGIYIRNVPFENAYTGQEVFYNLGEVPKYIKALNLKI